MNITQNPTQEWTVQQVRNFFYDIDSVKEKSSMRYLLHDKGPQFRGAFQNLINSSKNERDEKIKSVVTNCPQMNSYCERVIQSIQVECTDNIIFIGERMLRYTLKQYQEFYNNERHHQGSGNMIPFGDNQEIEPIGEICCSTRLAGLLRKYYRKSV